MGLQLWEHLWRHEGYASRESEVGYIHAKVSEEELESTQCRGIG